MKFRSISFSFREAFKNLWRNRLMSVASISSVMATLLILGLIFILIININSFVEGAQDQFDEITVYLKDELSDNDIKKTGQDLSSIIGVKEVSYKSKEEALNQWREEWGDQGYLLDGLNNNPLPNGYVVTLKDIEYTDSVVEIIMDFDGVEEVKFYKDIIDKVLSVSEFIRNIGFGLILALLAISTFIITNTIKLAVNARKREINIMKYVGATNWFIRWPFLLEGTILGLIGAAISGGIIFIIYSYMYNYFTTEFYTLIASHFVPAEAVLEDLFVIFAVLGMGIGALGSMNAMRKHLNV
ncbi:MULTISPECIES: permease-like cell division protein FtsX [unclassified Fusibacter]|uniref:permease-like cell division protein FtsX n=1 Tax=unclassified Fusibacter TaxID=2624464 RepID=UPI001010A529|nr:MULTISPECIES: permease-like cell division protein FtsX [unclassified Fusibacter]MCK8060568.1 permease-like cell division protein FtsX [Fusibacter sp. A2]NPE22978.1 ABC transporter permease [Fusibacter sp. A1]RXV60043.1 ABC transporter permease [Fusibacter sp. A1]